MKLLLNKCQNYLLLHNIAIAKIFDRGKFVTSAGNFCIAAAGNLVQMKKKLQKYQYKKFCHQPLNLVIRAKKTAVQNREASFVYEKRFNDQVIRYALTIVLCQLCFGNMPKLNKEQQPTCVNHFDYEACTFCVEFVQKMFVPIYLKNSSSVTLSG